MASISAHTWIVIVSTGLAASCGAAAVAFPQFAGLLSAAAAGFLALSGKTTQMARMAPPPEQK